MLRPTIAEIPWSRESKAIYESQTGVGYRMETNLRRTKRKGAETFPVISAE